MEIQRRVYLISPAIHSFVYFFFKATMGWILAVLRAGIRQGARAALRSAAPTSASLARSFIMARIRESAGM
jgi:hypothetical protein